MAGGLRRAARAALRALVRIAHARAHTAHGSKEMVDCLCACGRCVDSVERSATQPGQCWALASR
eukprot:164061-Alexandrium_andersonii.AAC.1